MENVYNTLKEGNLGEIRMDKKTQAMLYNGLVQPNYPSINGAGRYKLEFVMTLDDGSEEEADFGRVIVTDR